MLFSITFFTNGMMMYLWEFTILVLLVEFKLKALEEKDVRTIPEINLYKKSIVSYSTVPYKAPMSMNTNLLIVGYRL